MIRDGNGKITNYVAVMRDMSALSDLEQQLRQAQKMESIGRLAGGVAHDFNNRLMPILGYAEMYPADLPPEDPKYELVVEDDTAVRELVCKVLANEGYTVLDAEDPNTSLRRVDEFDGHVDLLLTDVVMPHMNGMELYRQLGPRLPGLKVLYMSGYADDVIHRLDRGVDLIQKPVSMRALIRRVREVLDDPTRT